jgi:two-component system, OmpR family, alkaline phosphatase synthesis response regulator PhoP
MNKTKHKILVVDDEKDIVDLLRYNLSKNGFDVITAYDGIEGWEKLVEQPNLILLDVMVPGMDGYEFCSKVKNSNKYKKIPVVFLTAKSSEFDEMRGLSLGASDFIQKPVSINRVIARIKSNLRIYSQSDRSNEDPMEISVGPIYLSREKFLVKINEEEVSFVRKEFELLYYMISNTGKVLNRDKILGSVWGEDVNVVERTVDVHMLKIRRKLGMYSGLIETIKGVGYRFKSPL